MTAPTYCLGIRRASRIATLLLVLAMPAAAQHADSPLAVGDVFPPLSGSAISGRHIDAPVPGRPTVVIMAFSRGAGEDAQRWAERLEPDSALAEVVLVAELQSAPRLLRGAIAYTIRRGVPAKLRDHMLLLDRDEAVWKRRLGVASTNRAYVTLIDATGRVRWMSRGVSDDTSMQALREELSVPARPPRSSGGAERRRIA